MPYLIVTAGDGPEFAIHIYPLAATNTDAEIAHVLECERLTDNNARAYLVHLAPADAGFIQAQLATPLAWEPDRVDIDACRAHTAPMTTMPMPFIPVHKAKRSRLDPLARPPFPEDYA